jgi:hypothetical protein
MQAFYNRFTKEKYMHHEQNDKKENRQNHDHSHTDIVQLTVDGNGIEIPKGAYRVAELKVLLGVPAEYELEIIENGQFRPLDENSNLTIKEHADFVSHVRCGASSQ